MQNPRDLRPDKLRCARIPGRGRRPGVQNSMVIRAKRPQVEPSGRKPLRQAHCKQQPCFQFSKNDCRFVQRERIINGRGIQRLFLAALRFFDRAVGTGGRRERRVPTAATRPCRNSFGGVSEPSKVACFFEDATWVQRRASKSGCNFRRCHMGISEMPCFFEDDTSRWGIVATGFGLRSRCRRAPVAQFKGRESRVKS